MWNLLGPSGVDEKTPAFDTAIELTSAESVKPFIQAPLTEQEKV